MSKRTIRLTPELSTDIIAFIRAGAFPLVAAEAAGVPSAHFQKWIEIGEKGRARAPYRSLAREVRKAAATARILQERAVYQKDAKYWLAHGPGKETPGNPGWTGEVRPINLESASSRLGAPRSEWESILSKIKQALAAFPEAQIAVAAALSGEPPSATTQPAEPRSSLPDSADSKSLPDVIGDV
jgi:hypothetical protein